MTTLDPHIVWNTTLEDLRTSMTRINYDTWLSHSLALSLQDDTLTIQVPNHYTRDWLKNRLIQPINRAVSQAAGKPLVVRFTLPHTPPPTTPPLSSQASALDDQQAEQLTLQGDYVNEYTAIVKPDRVMVFTQYFRQKWIPRLGPTLSTIIMELRQRCYWNRFTGEKRDTCTVSLTQLAQAIGVCRRTVIRALKKPDASRFILDTQSQYHYDSQVQRTVKTPTVWRIRLDEPYTDEDQPTSETRKALTD